MLGLGDSIYLLTAAAPTPPSLIHWYGKFGLTLMEGFGQTEGGSSFRQGYAAAASIVLFILVLIIGMAANFIVARRERKYLG